MITIGLPVYNAQDFIKETIMSIQNQTYKEWNCIIIDDGSIDLSVQVIESVVKDDARFTLICDGDNKGLADRLNQIASLAKTPYLARMDADDIMYPERLEEQLKCLNDHPEVDIVGSAAYVIDQSNKIFGIRLGLKAFTIIDCVYESPFIHPTIMGRTKWFVANKYDPKAERYEDYELWLRSAENSKFLNLDKPLLFYREGGAGHAGKYIATADGIIATLENKIRETEDVNLKRHLNKKIREVKFKRLAYKTAGRFSLEGYLVKSRSQNISENDLRNATSSLHSAIKF